MRLSRVISAAILSLLDRLYIKPLRGLISATTFRYVACGVVNYFILDALLYYIIYHYVIPTPLISIGGVVVSSHIASLVVLFPITLFNGFWLNRNVAFRVEALPVGRQLFTYIGTIFGSLLLSYVVMKLFVDVLGLWATPSKILTSVTTSLYSYLMARFVTFKQ